MRNRNKGIILSYVNKIVSMLCGLFLSSFYLRSLGAIEYGIYQTIASFANYLVLLEFGMGNVITRNISVCRGRGADDEEIARNASTVWTLTWMLSAVILVFSAVFYFSIPGLYSNSMSVEQIAYAQRMFIPITGYLIISFLIQTLDGLLLAYEEYSLASLRELVRTAAKTLILVLVLTFWRYVILIAAVDLLLSFVCLLGSYRFCVRKLGVRLKLGVCDRAIVRTSVSLCLAIFLQCLVNQANNNVDKFLIGIKMNPESVTLYSVGLYIFGIFSALTTIPVSMYAPRISQVVAQGKVGRALEADLVGPCRMTAMVGGLVLFGFIGVGRQFICLLYGEEYFLSWPIAIILMAPMYINMVNGVLVNVLDVLNKRMVRSVTLTLTTVANIILTVFWLDRWGVIGASAATALCTLIGQVLLMNLYYSKKLNIPVISLFGKSFRGILIYLVIGSIGALVIGRVLDNQFLSFILGGMAFAVISVGGFLLFGMTPEEKAAVLRIVSVRRKGNGR